MLIFDEVMTGFRVAFGGAQELYDIKPDLTTLGKIIGGGLPVGAYGGPAEIMDLVAPLGPMYQAGTLSGNPLAMAAGLRDAEQLRDRKGEIYPRLEKLERRSWSRELLRRRKRRAFRCATIALDRCLRGSFRTAGHGLGFGRRNRTPKRLEDSFGACWIAEFILPPSQYEAAFLERYPHGRRCASRRLRRPSRRSGPCAGNAPGLKLQHF